MRPGPPTAGGRWFVLGGEPVDGTADKLARTESLLARYGVVTRGSVVAEQTPGGFSAVYRVLREIEQTGACLRGYYVETLGAAQFAAPSTIDRLRTFARDDDAPTDAAAVVLAATDPANPFGAALPWPDRAVDDAAPTHRPARKSGAMVVLHDGSLVAYLERGGKKVIVFDDRPERLAAAAAALVQLVRSRRIARLTIETVGGTGVHDTAWAETLRAAGFERTPKGLRADA